VAVNRYKRVNGISFAVRRTAVIQRTQISPVLIAVVGQKWRFVAQRIGPPVIDGP